MDKTLPIYRKKGTPSLLEIDREGLYDLNYILTSVTATRKFLVDDI